VGVQDCRAVELPVIHAPEGNLTAIEGEGGVPFPIKRVYYLYDVPTGAVRGGHAHRSLQQLLVPLSGSFDVLLDDGVEKCSVHLNRPSVGLLLTPMIWRELVNFSSGSVCLVLASAHYEESDYFRRYEDFLAAVGDAA
jgi:hypothetical protein